MWFLDLRMIVPLKWQKRRTHRPPARKRRKLETTIEVLIDKQQVFEGCITLVTENGRSFKTLDDSGFRMIGRSTISAEILFHE